MLGCAIGVVDLLDDVDAGVRVGGTRRIERQEEVVVADVCAVPDEDKEERGSVVGRAAGRLP